MKLLYLIKTKPVKGKIWLIPVTLGSENYEDMIPAGVLEITRRLRYFIVENLRSARRFLRLIDKDFPIDESVFYELNKHTSGNDMSIFFQPLLEGNDIGLMSEAGLPGIADPGAEIITEAHREKIIVTPLSGPSSIIMALISSGMNGQNFTFNGYLPVKSAERAARIRELEKKADEGFTQIFMETPYRNQALLESLLGICNPERLLCIAADITKPSEYIRTMPIKDWKRDKPDLKNRPAIFVLQ